MMETGQNEIRNALTTLSMVKEFHTEGKYCDVQLQVDNMLFKCQRSLLAAISSFFHAMFSGDFKESDTTSNEPITLHGLDATAFKEILNFIYTGDICINSSNVYGLLFMSDFLQLRTGYIKEQCVKYLSDRSQNPEPISNALDLFSFGSMKAETKLVDILTTHICEHLHHYSKEEKLMEIPFEHLNTLLKFSKKYILSLPGSQNVVLKIIHNWINHNREERYEYRCKLMENINFSNVSSDFMSLLMKELDNFADAVLGLPKNTEKTLKIGMVNDLTVGDARFEGTILFDVKNLSRMEIDEMVFSSHTMISNLLWKIGIQRSDTDLDAFLYCDGPNDETLQWKCCANATFILVSLKEEKKKISISCGPNFYYGHDKSGWGCELISWSDLIEVENGYIKTDDSITLETHVYPDVPLYSFQNH